MAKEVAGLIKLQIKGGAANPSPPVGPALGSKGINIMEFCKQFNARTQDKAGKILPVIITYYADKSFDFVIKTPPVAIQLLEVAKVKSGSAEPNRKKVAEITWEQVRTIAQDMVDEKKIAFNPAYELSFLKKEEQVDLLDAMDSEQATPSLSQAQRLKKYSQEGHLTLDMMRVIMGEEKKSDLDKITFTSDTLRKYFPRSYTPQRMQETIIKLLEQWQRKRQQQHDR